jgi:hypothetical protein
MSVYWGRPEVSGVLLGPSLRRPARCLCRRHIGGNYCDNGQGKGFVKLSISHIRIARRRYNLTVDVIAAHFLP